MFPCPEEYDINSTFCFLSGGDQLGGCREAVGSDKRLKNSLDKEGCSLGTTKSVVIRKQGNSNARVWM